MRIKDMIAAIRGYTQTKAELASTKDLLEVCMDEKMALENRCTELNNAGWNQQYEVQCLKFRNEALVSVMREYCPQLETTEDMKRFYDAVAPALDKDEFKLYLAAQKITGVNLYNEFPYEDNSGRFEEACSHELVDYLIAANFGAVEWDIVPGTSYERATLREVDKTTTEYKAFEKAVYAEALRKLDFADMLPPEKAAEKVQKTERRTAHER